MATNSKWMRGAKSKVKDLIAQAIAAGLSKTNITELAGFIVGLICEYRLEAYKDGVRDTEEALMKTGVDHGATHEVTRDDETFEVPFVVFFTATAESKAGYYFFEVLDNRVPEKGDYYLTGHMTEAMFARKDHEDDESNKHLIIRRTHLVRKATTWRRVED